MYVSKLPTVKRECRFRGWTRLQAHRQHSLVAALSDAQVRSSNGVCFIPVTADPPGVTRPYVFRHLPPPLKGTE
jgi:hypothetical protein